MHTYIPALWSLAPLSHHRALSWAPVLYSSFPLAIHFTRGSVHMSVLLSQFIPPSPSWAVSTVHSLWLRLFLPCKYVHQFHAPFSCVNIRYLFFFFWLTSLCMTGSRSIHITTNDPISFSRLSVFHCMYIWSLYSQSLWVEDTGVALQAGLKEQRELARDPHAEFYHLLIFTLCLFLLWLQELLHRHSPGHPAVTGSPYWRSGASDKWFHFNYRLE